MQTSFDRGQRAVRRLRPVQAGKGRWMVNDYPAGYVAQLARPHTAKACRRSRPDPARPRVEQTSGNHRMH